MVLCLYTTRQNKESTEHDRNSGIPTKKIQTYLRTFYSKVKNTQKVKELRTTGAKMK